MTHKILVTLGPSSLFESVVTKCAAQGVHVFRINLSHTALDQVAPLIDKIQGWTDVPICLDSEGAQMRNQAMETEAVVFFKDARVNIHFEPVIGNMKWARTTMTPPSSATAKTISKPPRTPICPVFW